jgi:hypothetical protein
LWYSLNGTGENFVSWGPEYLRNITREIVAEYEERQEKFVSNFQVEQTGVLDVSVRCFFFFRKMISLQKKNPRNERNLILYFTFQDLIQKVMEIVPYYIQRHNEIDAIDLLVEVQHLQAIVPVSF